MEECLSNQQKLHDLLGLSPPLKSTHKHFNEILESQHASVLARLDALDHTNQQIVRNAQESSFIRRSRSALEGMRKSAGTGATTDVGLAYLERRELPNTVKTSSSRPSSSNHQERNANPLGSGEQPTQRTRSRTTNVYSLPQHDVPPQPPSYPTPSSYPCPQQVLTSNEHEVELRFCTPDSKDSEAAQLAKAILSSALYGDGTGSPTHTTLLKLFDLGRSLGADKRHDEAVEILEQVLIRGKSVRGFADHHLDVLACVMKCGHGFSKESRHSESEKAYTLAWVGREEILGPRHVDTLSALYGIGIALRGQGREGEALKVLLPCLDAQKGILGSSHELVGRTHYWIGKCRVDQRDYHEAELRFGEAYAILKRALGERNLETLKILQNRGTNLTKQGRNAEALVMLNQVRSLGEDVFDRNSTTMTKTHYWLGRTFENMSRWAEAEDAYSDAYRRSLACPDYERDHPSTAKIKERLDASRVQLRLLNCQQSTTNGERGGMFGKLPT
jgi:tetratricopeptide (TPR) repeat protein